VKKINRREFLKASAGTAFLVMAPGVLTGCADSQNSLNRIGAAADLHMHLQRQKMADRMINVLGRSDIYGRPIIESNGKLLISHLDGIGASRAFAFSAAYIWGAPLLASPEFPRLPVDEEYEEVKAENDWAAAQAAEYPDRLVPFFSVHPFADYALDEIERCKRDLNLSTMKLHFGGSMVSLQDAEQLPFIKGVFTKAASLNLRVVIHFRNDDPDFGVEDARIFIDEILAPHPDLKVQLAHLGSNGGFDDVTADVFGTFIQTFARNPRLRKERLFFDLSFVILQKDQVLPDGTLWRKATTHEECRRLAAMVRSWGIENILWGSDFFMADPSEYVSFTRQMLPLAGDEYNVIMNNTGNAFLA
jgi:predicted TIM-barrel fold metal-dependent hydrolase